MTESQASDLRWGPSRRALASFHHGKAWDLMGQIKQRPQYDPEMQPGGVINLSGALNILMRDWMESYTKEYATALEINKQLPYGSIFGTPELQGAMAGFFNRFFSPARPIEPSNIVATNGVTALINLMAWTLCEPGDAILMPTPTFYMLDYDLSTCTETVSVPVSMTGVDDPFGGEEEDIDQVIRLLHSAADASVARGNRPRMLFICNPANPQGRSYSSKMLRAFARFCALQHMHLVADEIYALSQFGDAEFSSVHSIEPDLDVSIDTRQMVHGLYGLSKDFDMGGLRMGFLVTRNDALLAAIKRVTWFTWITAFSDSFVTQFMGNLDLVEEYRVIYQERLAKTYSLVSDAMIRHSIPFQQATSGLFVFIDLSQWLGYFEDSQADASRTESAEIRLCKWLVDDGVFINPGEFAFSDRPGHYRFVFTEQPVNVVLLAVQRIRESLDRLVRGGLSAHPLGIDHPFRTDDESTPNGSSVSPSLREEQKDADKQVGRTSSSLGGRLLKKLDCFS
ncbi:PLP-dependent transferase [Thozetella sp. PMI_491]|nr:PLP-dependent transferase [Thozetella sp. PMI_491]